MPSGTSKRLLLVALCSPNFPLSFLLTSTAIKVNGTTFYGACQSIKYDFSKTCCLTSGFGVYVELTLVPVPFFVNSRHRQVKRILCSPRSTFWNFTRREIITMGFLAISAALGATAVALSGWNVGGNGGILPTADAALFNAIVPNLSSGWFAKPGPTESLLFGLIVLKVMAMRATGLFPYNLNELWQDDKFFQHGFGGFDLEKIWRRKGKGSSGRTQRDLYFAKLNKSSKAPLLKEIDTVERILLGLRRIDSHDCFIRHVCQIKQKQISGKSSAFDDSVLEIFSLKPQRKESESVNPSIWDIYHDALTPEVIDCSQKYHMCPLAEKDMSPSSILSGFY